MKNKKTIYLALLVVITVAFIVAWFIMKNVNGKDDGSSTTDDTESALLIRPEVAKEDVLTIEYTTENGTFSFKRDEDGKWIYNSDADFPLNQTKPNSMATTLAVLEASREIVDGDEDSFGFDNPTVTLKATYSDGSEINALIGASNDFYDGKYYFKDIDSGKIYLVPSSVEVSFEAVEQSLISADTFPTDIDGESAVSAVIRDDTGKERIIDGADALSDFSDLFNGLSFSADRAIYTGEKGVDAYGITDKSAKISVSYKKEVKADSENAETVYADEEYEILFGNSFTGDSGSTMYYYTVPASKLVYTLSADSYEEIMNYSHVSTDTVETAE